MMARYYCENNSYGVTIFKEVTAGAFENRVKQNKPIFEGTEEQIMQLADDFRRMNRKVKIIEK